MDLVENWFGTPYYYLLYSHRSEAEAQNLLDNLIRKVQLLTGAKVLDVACGNGRHSRYMAGRGYHVTGLDVVPENINKAIEHEAIGRLHFIVHDMRMPFPETGFDLIINIFTSFGYFKTEEEDINSLLNMRNALNEQGNLVIDFMNAKKVINTLRPEEGFSCGNIHFKLKREIQNNFVLKKIQVTEGNIIQSFQEKVKLLTLANFQAYFKKTGLELLEYYGDYNLGAFCEESSDRLLMILKKV